jgi:hypothetical protein
MPQNGLKRGAYFQRKMNHIPFYLHLIPDLSKDLIYGEFSLPECVSDDDFDVAASVLQQFLCDCRVDTVTILECLIKTTF